MMVAVAVAMGQGFPGGFGGGGFAKPSQLINNDQIQKELKLTPEQLKKLDAAVLKAIDGVLEPDQAKRLHQISLQLRGFQAFGDAAVQAELKFTDEQKDTIKKILDDNAEKMKEIQAEGFGGFAKIGPLMKETQAKVGEVLTDAQKDHFKEMVGAQFKFEFKGFKFKKKDE
jgi:Spy/CpxP family protein refolding chaperone